MTTTHIRVNIKAYSAESAPSAPCHNLVKNLLMNLLLCIPVHYGRHLHFEIVFSPGIPGFCPHINVEVVSMGLRRLGFVFRKQCCFFKRFEVIPPFDRSLHLLFPLPGSFEAARG